MTNPFTPFNPEHLPNILPSSANLLSVLSSDEVSLEDVAIAVEANPTIAAKLLAVANSPWARPVATITSLRAACARLGLDIVRSFALAVAMGRAFDTNRCPTFSPRRYWLSAVLTSEMAANMAPQQGVRPSTARTVGLLHNVGLLALADQLPDAVDEALRAPDTHAALTALCGTGYMQAGHMLLEHWNLPEALLEGFVAGPLHDLINDALAQTKLLMREEEAPEPLPEPAARVGARIDQARALAELLAA